MAKKKAELEADADAYRMRMSLARESEARGLYVEAVSHASDALSHVDGMLQFAKRYEERTFGSVEAIDFLLRYVPFLLSLEHVERLESTLAQFKRIDRDVEQDIAGAAKAARQRTWDNHRLWAFLESRGEACQDALREELGGDQAQWRTTAEGWERMGLVVRVREGASYRVSLATRLNQVIGGKCPHCGEVSEAPKAMLLEPVNCPSCRKTGSFVLVG